MISSLLSLATLAAVPALAAPAAAAAGNCFPVGNATLPGNFVAPSTPLSQWWCPQSDYYGFLGFSYPLEDGNCNAASNGYAQMNQDFAQMKRDFGASIVRMYYPVCTQPSVFINAIKAAYNNNMGLVVQVWTNFGGGNVWQQSQQAIYNALNDPSVASFAPYVVHWAEFGSEPVGDGMDSGNFVNDLGKFRATLNQKGILVGISEDWDRPGVMSGNGGKGLATIGAGVKANSDVAHIHPMPFYHFNQPASQAWSYIQSQIAWVKTNVGLPTWISETQWAWGPTDHYPGHTDLGRTQYANYWKTLDNNCAYFKAQNVGWFLHAWRGENTFDIVDPNGSRKRATCSWEGHCAGASCGNDNDCSDDLTCSNGFCGGSAPPPPPPPPPPSGGCSWEGHCAGAACGSDNDCSDDLTCSNGFCGGSPGNPGGGDPGNGNGNVPAGTYIIPNWRPQKC